MTASTLYLAFLATTLTAADQETLPPPRTIVVPQPEPIYRYYRQSLDRTPYYRPDFRGIPRPVVVYSPGYGFYYLYNGQPYFPIPMYPNYVRGAELGVPYRSGPVMPAYVLPVVPDATQKPAPAKDSE